MSDAPTHPTEALQDAIDGRLDSGQRAALDAHLATCEACRRELAVLQRMTAHVAKTARTVDMPGDLDAHVRRTLDEEDRRQAGHRAEAVPGRPAARSSLPYWIAAAAALIAVVWLAYRSFAPTAPAQAAADFRAFVSGATALEIQTTDPAMLESRLRAAGLPFAVRVFDFGMMNYTLTGGGLHRLGGRPSALFAYRSADGRALLCQMYEGRVEDLPAPSDRRRQNDIEFLVYRERELTVIFWEEGDVLCVLVADGDPEAAIRLAFAKAAKV